MSTPRMKRPAKKHAVPAVVSKRGALAADIRQLIEVARQQVAQAVNGRLTGLHWRIGDRIRREILWEKRADYGAAIVSTLSRQLEPEFGRGFSNKALRHMIRFADMFPDPEIVAALRRQLGRTRFTDQRRLHEGQEVAWPTSLRSSGERAWYDLAAPLHQQRPEGVWARRCH